MRSGRWAGRALAIPVLAALFAALSAKAIARPYSVEDLVHQESFGGIAFDPTGGWLVYERRIARANAPAFADQTRPEVVENQLRIAPASGAAPSKPLIPGDPTGVTMGPFAPDGRHLAVYGLRRGSWRLGVVTLSTGRLRWFGIRPEFPYRTRTVQWRSSTDIIAVDRPATPLPLILRVDKAAALALPERWRRTARGQLAVTAVGSGRYVDQRPHKAPSRLVSLDIHTGKTTSLAVGEIDDIEVASDGRHVAFCEAGEDIRLRPDQPVQGPNGTAWHRERLGIVDLETGRVSRPLGKWDLAGQLLSWSPSGRQLLIFARPDGAPWDAGTPLRVTRDGVAERLPLGDFTPVLHVRPEAPRAAWLGETPALLVRHAGRQDWVALNNGQAMVITANMPAVPDSLRPLPDGAAGLAGGRLWKLTPAGAEPFAAPADLSGTPGRVLWEVRLVSNPPAASPLLARRLADGAAWAINLVGDGLMPTVRLPDRDSRPVAVAPRSGALAATASDAHGVQRLYLGVGGRWSVVDTVDRRQADVEPLRALAVSQPSADPGSNGEPLQAWLYLPTRPPGAPAPPLIVSPYPGQRHRAPATLKDYDAGFLTPSIPVLVGQGFAVLEPSLPLAAGAEPAQGLAARVLAIVDAAAAQHPGAFDPSRLALWGHSLGGYGTMAIITQTDRFRAAVEMAGPSDLISVWGKFQPPEEVDPSEGLAASGEMGWTENSQGAMGAPPWQDPGRYLRNSPIFQADRIHTPLLIIGGDQDHIPMAQGQEMFSALYRQDRDAMLVTYWGEGHILYSPGNVRDAYRRGFAWIAENLARPATSALRPGGEPGHGSVR